MIPKTLVFVILNVLLVFGQNCPSSERGPTIDQTKAYLREVDSLVALDKEILNLQKKCLDNPFSSVTSLEFAEGRCVLEREFKESVSRFFDPVIQAEAASCYQIRGPEDVLPEEKYTNVNGIIEKFRSRNPVLFEDLLKTWRKALDDVRAYYKTCVNRDQIFEHPFFKAYGPGIDIQEVKFIAKNPSLSSFYFKHQFVKSNPTDEKGTETGNNQALVVAREDKLVSSPLNDLFKFVDTHFIPKIISGLYDPEDPQVTPNVEESPQSAVGFQIHHQKAGFLYKTLDSINLRLNLVGNLTLYVFDNRGKLRESEVIRNIDTQGKWAEVFVSELNIPFGDKDMLLFDYEGIGAFRFRESKEEQFEGIKSNNLIFLNKLISRDHFSKPRAGQKYEIVRCKTSLDAEILLSKGDGKKKQSPKVEIKFDSA